jgi:integrase/recombinase XerD
MAGIDHEQDQTIIMNFLADLDLQGSTKKTIENYRSCVRIYVQWLHKQDLNILSVADNNNKAILEEFLRYLRYERTTDKGHPITFSRIKVFFSALNSLYEYLQYNNKIKKNIVLTVRKRYLKQFKNGYVPAVRKVINVREMSGFLNSISNPQAKAINILFVKTGLRRDELRMIDVDNVDYEDMSIMIKSRQFKKRSNPLVFFDHETKKVLQYWLKHRNYIAKTNEKALFVGTYGGRISKNATYDAVTDWAKRYGLFDSSSDRLEDHFSCHNYRHQFTTFLNRGGMPREYIQELRGDKHSDIIDIYNHIDRDDLKREYLAAMPKFNIF